MRKKNHIFILISFILLLFSRFGYFTNIFIVVSVMVFVLYVLHNFKHNYFNNINNCKIISGLYLIMLGDKIANFSINTMKALVIVGILIIINGVVNRIRKVGIKNYFNWNFDS